MYVAADAIEASCSYTVFYMPAGADKTRLKPYVEVYWQINPETVNFTKEDKEQWQAKIATAVSFTNEAGVLVNTDKYILQTNPTDTAGLFRQNIVELHRYELPPGKYVLDLQLIDVARNENEFSYTDTLTISQPPASRPFFSGIQLVDTVMDVEKTSPFLRNGRQQIPLCFNYLDDNRGRMQFYTELYQSTSVAKSNSPLTRHLYISKKPGEKWAQTYRKTDTIEPAFIMPITAGFDIESLPSGNYYLNIELQDKHDNHLATASVFFQRNNPNPVVEQAQEDTTQQETFEKVEVFDLGKTFVNKYDTRQLKAILKMLLPISTQVEEKAIATFLKKPEETYMRYFVYNFWTARNERDPKKAWDEYADKVREVNKLFGSAAIPGYETDRGLIWLEYGKPEERIVVQNEQGVLPYEIWKYNAPGRQSAPGVFLFYRPGFMITDYRLLHSTVNGEVRNMNWRMQLYTSGGSSGYANSRAEQYIGNK